MLAFGQRLQEATLHKVVGSGNEACGMTNRTDETLSGLGGFSSKAALVGAFGNTLRSLAVQDFGTKDATA